MTIIKILAAWGLISIVFAFVCCAICRIKKESK